MVRSGFADHCQRRAFVGGGERHLDFLGAFHDVVCRQNVAVGRHDDSRAEALRFHRARVLAEIRADLKEGRPCRVISTSLVEAGVDVDFPLVLRASAELKR